MKKFYITLASIIVFASLAVILTSGITEIQTMLRTGGAPAGYTGSPGDAKVCTSCHAGPAAASQTGWITSAIPVSGYVPNTTYAITAKVTRAGHTKFGFEVSPQNNAGALLGTLGNTSTETQLVGSDKYVTHTSASTNGNGSRSWTFNWTAPVKGTGSVTFYGAFNASSSNSANTGDTIFTSTLVVSENTSVGIDQIKSIESNFSVFPNPASDKINIRYSLTETSSMVINLFDSNGRLADILFSGTKPAGKYSNSFNIDRNSISRGIYFLEFNANGSRSVRKILIE